MKDRTIASYNGTVYHVGGSGPGNYSTIQQGVDAASDGDVVLLHDAGSYTELVTVNSEIWIKGNGSRINPPISILPRGFTLNANNVTITGMMLSYFYMGIFSEKYGHNITGNVFFENDNDIYISCSRMDIHSSWTSEGITISDNVFDRDGPGDSVRMSLSLKFDGENITNSSTGDIRIDDNDFRSSSTGGTFVSITSTFTNLYGGTMDVGDIVFGGNDMMGASLGFSFFSVFEGVIDTTVDVGALRITENVIKEFSYHAVAMDYYDFNEIGGNSRVIVDDLIIRDNQFISTGNAGGISISDYALWYGIKGTSYFRSGNLTVYNNTIDVVNEGIVVELSITGTLLGGACKVITQDTRIVENRILNASNGIRVNIGGASSMKDDSVCILEEINISNNYMNCSLKAVKVDFFGMGNSMEDNSSLQVDGVRISGNTMKTNMIHGSSYGIEFNMEQCVNGARGNSSTVFKEMNISENDIEGAVGLLLGSISNIGINLDDDSSFVFEGISLYRNHIKARDSGIQINQIYTIGRELRGRATMDLEGLRLVENDINSSGYGIRINNIEQIGTYLESDSGFHMGYIDISGNLIESIIFGVFINYMTFMVSQLRGNSTSEMDGIRICENTMDTSLNGIEITRFYLFGTSVTDDAVASFKWINISKNDIRSDRNGLNIGDMENFGYILLKRGSFVMGSIVIEHNTIVAEMMGIYIDSITNFGIEMYSNSRFKMRDLRIQNNDIRSGDEGIRIFYLGNLGYFLIGSSVFDMGSVLIRENSVDSRSRGILIDQIFAWGTYLDDMSTFTIGDIEICLNRIDSDEVAIHLQSIRALGSVLEKNTISRIGRIDASGNTIRTNGTGIYLETIQEIGYRMKDAATLTMEGLFLDDNYVISLDSGIVIENMEDIGREMEDDSGSIISNISLSRNHVNSGDKGMGIGSLMNSFSYLTENASASMGSIEMNGNEIVSDGEGLFLNGIVDMGLLSGDNSSGSLGMIKASENRIRTNGTAIEMDEHRRSGNQMSGSASLTIGPRMIVENDIHSTNSAITLRISDMGDQMTSGSLVLGAIIMTGNLIDTGTGVSLNIGTSILTGTSSVNVDDIEFVNNRIKRKTDGDMFHLDLSADCRDNSVLTFGSTLIEGNDRISSNISGIHIEHDLLTGGAGTIDTGEVLILSNNITDCDTGMEFSSVNSATAYLNNFMGNSIDIDLGSASMTWTSPDEYWYKHENRNFSSRLGNHWDTYSGPDLDNDGIGDNPYDTGFGSDEKPILNGIWSIFPPWTDITPPVINIISPINGSLTNDSEIALEWEVTDDLLGVEFQWVRMDGGPWTMVISGSSYLFSTVSEGLHSIEVRAADYAGNENSSRTGITVDLTAPDLDILFPADGSAFNVTTVGINWTGTDTISNIHGYEIAIGNGTFRDMGPDTSEILEDLPEGMHHIHVRATDNAGNVMTTMVTIYIDLTDPVVDIIHPTHGSISTSNRINASWSGDGGLTTMISYRIYLDGEGPIDVGTATSRVLEGLEEGQHSLEVLGFDAGGNHASSMVSFTVDTSTAGVAILEPADGSFINTTEISATWRVNGMTHILDIVEYRMDSGNWIRASVAGSLIRNLSEGEHKLDVRARDIKDNTASGTSTFIVDLTDPSITSVSHEGTDAVVRGPLVIEFSENIGSALITMNGDITEASVDGRSVVISDPDLSPGTAYTIGVTFQDLAGNRANDTISFETASTGTVSGRIVDENGDPVSGGKIIFDSGEEAEIGNDGRFTAEVTHGSRTATVLDEDGNEIGSFEVEVTGGEISSQDDIEVDPEDEEEDSKLWVLIVAIVVTAMILIAVVAFILLAKGRETEEEEMDDDDIWEDDEEDDLDEDYDEFDDDDEFDEF